MLLIAVIFGSNHIAARIAFEHGTNVTTEVAFRSGGTALVLLLLLLFAGLSLITTLTFAFDPLMLDSFLSTAPPI